MELSHAFMTIIFNGYSYVCMVKMYTPEPRLLQERVYIHGVGSQWTGLTISSS